MAMAINIVQHDRNHVYMYLLKIAKREQNEQL